MKKRSIRDQWDGAIEAWVDFVHAGKDYYRTELNSPAMFEVLGDVKALRILDLGCGEGYRVEIVSESENQIERGCFQFFAGYLCAYWIYL